jgi:hypothetical protein
MNPVWLCFPTINEARAKECVGKWQNMGYKVAVWLEPGLNSVFADFEVKGVYPGYWVACNRLALACAVQASAIVLAADDMEPDPDHKPEDIVAECDARFPDQYWLMQPTGDDQDGMDGVWRICGSPWFGRAWVYEAFMGLGPCPLDYRAFYGDEVLYNVSKAQGVLWQRSDLMQYHNHWCRKGGPQKQEYQIANSDKHWDYDKAKFMLAMENGFPGSARLCRK